MQTNQAERRRGRVLLLHFLAANTRCQRRRQRRCPSLTNGAFFHLFRASVTMPRFRVVFQNPRSIQVAYSRHNIQSKFLFLLLSLSFFSLSFFLSPVLSRLLCFHFPLLFIISSFTTKQHRSKPIMTREGKWNVQQIGSSIRLRLNQRRCGKNHSKK